MKVKVINKSGNALPLYETKGSAGMDLRACLEETVLLKPGERILIKTGLYVEIPEGFELQIRPRSGLAIKHGITIINSPGTIDADFRGGIGVILLNTNAISGNEVLDSSNTFIIKNGDKIAQAVLNKIEQVEWEQVDELSETNRGEGGFGHTGI